MVNGSILIADHKVQAVRMVQGEVLHPRVPSRRSEPALCEANLKFAVEDRIGFAPQSDAATSFDAPANTLRL